jgi:hypothetical protein
VPEVLKRDSRARRFGIDCASELRWHAKDPGGDYKQTLILKNVSNQVIKFKFKLPETSFFFMKFPDLVTLSPGMASKVDVSFRPIEKAVYDDVVEFITSSGSFFIRVVATLKEQGLKVQEYLDFGFATVKEESHRQFVLKNVGEVDSPFELLAEPPFSVEPVSGVCKVGTSVPINLTFFPTEASVFVGTVVVKQPEGPSLVMKVSGIGKLPFLNVSEHLLDFGNVLLGQSMTLELIISNQSLVPVSYDLIPVPTDNDPAFKWSATSGKLPADSSVALIVKYTPLATGAFDCEYFDIVTPAGGIQKICCKGYAQPHDVQLAVTSINFGNLVLGKTSMRTVEIINQTNAQAFYQFVTEPSGCFEFSRTDGTIIPESTSNVDIRFKARTVGNFYRRIFILVKNQGPLYLDLTATAYHQVDTQAACPMQRKFATGVLTVIFSSPFGPDHWFFSFLCRTKTRCLGRCRCSRSTSKHGAGARCVETPRNRSKLGSSKTHTSRRVFRARKSPARAFILTCACFFPRSAAACRANLARSRHLGEREQGRSCSRSVERIFPRRCGFAATGLSSGAGACLDLRFTPSLLSSLPTFFHLSLFHLSFSLSLPLSSSTLPLSPSTSISLMAHHHHTRVAPCIYLSCARLRCSKQGAQDIEFGAPSGSGIGEYKTMTLCNNTGVKMTAMFVIPPDGYQTQPEGAGEIK